MQRVAEAAAEAAELAAARQAAVQAARSAAAQYERTQSDAPKRLTIPRAPRRVVIIDKPVPTNRHR